jgi:hypothetical protein
MTTTIVNTDTIVMTTMTMTIVNTDTIVVTTMTMNPNGDTGVKDDTIVMMTKGT